VYGILKNIETMDDFWNDERLGNTHYMLRNSRGDDYTLLAVERGAPDDR
jgi:hypothetical protein